MTSNMHRMTANPGKMPDNHDVVTLAMSSRALSNMTEENQVYKKQGLENYIAYQMAHKDHPLTPGVAFPFIEALMTVNSQLRDLYPESEEMLDVVLVTSNHIQVGERLINSIKHHSE